MEKLTTLCLSLIFISCSSNKFIKQIEKIDKENNLYTYKENKIFFNYLGKQLINTNHVYYMASTIDNENDIQGINVVVFDEENDIVYNLEFDKLSEKPLIIKTQPLDDAYNNFVYTHFKNNHCDSLKNLSNKTQDISGISSEDRIYELDLRNNSNNRVCHFQRIDYFLEIYEQNLKK